MAKPTGFLEFYRELPTRRPVSQRIGDWLEVYDEFPEGSLRDQAARCMDCGIPYCHQGCPVNNIIPEWNDLVHKKKKFSAVWTVLPTPGKIRTIKGVDIAKRMKGVKEIIIMKQKNDKIPKIIDNTKRPVYVISEATSYVQAMNIARNAASKIKFLVDKS